MLTVNILNITSRISEALSKGSDKLKYKNNAMFHIKLFDVQAPLFRPNVSDKMKEFTTMAITQKAFFLLLFQHTFNIRIKKTIKFIIIMLSRDPWVVVYCSNVHYFAE